MPGPHSQTKPPSVLTQRPSQAALRHSSMSRDERRELEMGGCHRRREPPIPLGPPRPGSPVQRTPLAVSTMEKPSGQTRATSWHPPWLQERSQPYSPHVPGGSETRTGGPQGTDATSHPSPALWYPLPGSPRDLHPTPAASLPLPRMGTVLGDAARRGDEEQRAPPGKPGGPGFRHDRQQERVGTWAGDALLSIGARAEVGSDAQAAAAAEGAERCRERGQATLRRAGTPHPFPVPPESVLTQGALPAARRQHPPGTTSAAEAREADVGPDAAPA